MKKSDQKQWDKAWESFNSGMSAFSKSIVTMQKLEETDYSIDDLTRLGSQLKKIAVTIDRVVERKEYIEEEEYGRKRIR